MKQMNLPEKLKRITWVTAVARQHTPLLLSLVITGEQDPIRIKQQTGMSIMFSHIRRKGLAMQFDKNELTTSRDTIRNEVSRYGLTFFNNYANRCLKSCNEFLQLAESLNKPEDKKRNLRILNTQLQRYFNAATTSACHLIVLISVQYELENFIKRFVTDRISNTKQAEQILNSLKITIEPTHEIANLERLLELGRLVQKRVSDYREWIIANPQILKTRIQKEFPLLWRSIKSYQKDFGWMGRMYYAGSPITEVDIIIRLQNNLRHDCMLRLTKIHTDRKQQLAQREKSIAELGGDNESRLLADIVSRYMYLRSYRLNVFFIAHEHAVGLLTNASEKLKLVNGLDDIIFLDWREILAGLKRRLAEEKLRYYVIQRQKGFEFLSINGKTEWFSPAIKPSTAIKGVTACTGKYTGRVRLILNDEAMKEMASGEVLVTTMTTPSLMLAVEKAGAIVTDEGGMLCHAAIVSRELNIPCVIATKVATRRLKDGDIVEVDANREIVTILKTSS